MTNDLRIILNNYVEGDNQAVADIYCQLKDQLLLIAYNHCRDQFTARDIVQDVFEKLINLSKEKRNRYFGNPKTNFIGFLSVFIRNKSIDARKVNLNRNKIIHSIRYSFNTQTQNTSSERFLQDGLKLMVNNLQAREKEILGLHLDGYSNEEIAKALELTYNTVKNNIYESKKKLKEMWHLFMI